MELAWFILAFDRAAALCRDFAQRFVTDELPFSLRFDFAAAGRPTDQSGRVKYLGGRLLLPAQLRGVESARAQKYLWVDGKVPQWVNLSVHAIDADHTYVEVCVTDRLVGELAHMYHQGEGNPPFHVLGPALPSSWVSLAESGRFSLRWRAAEQSHTQPGIVSDPAGNRDSGDLYFTHAGGGRAFGRSVSFGGSMGIGRIAGICGVCLAIGLPVRPGDGPTASGTKHLTDVTRYEK